MCFCWRNLLLESCYVNEKENYICKQCASLLCRENLLWVLIGRIPPSKSLELQKIGFCQQCWCSQIKAIEDHFSPTLEAVLLLYFQCTCSFQITVWNSGENRVKRVSNAREAWLVKCFPFVSGEKQILQCQPQF